MNGEVRVVDDVPTAFAQLVADEFAGRDNPDRFTLALSGGSTAKPCYELLAKTDVDWSRATITWGDERCVPLDHADSNYRAAKETFLDNVPSFGAVHPMDCTKGADAYDAIIAGLEPIEVIHLGMGEDGHTASLFPGSPALDAPADRHVVETGDELHPHPRLTFTFAAIAQARVAVFTVMGAKKREMFRRIQSGEHLPAGQVAAHRVIWLVDPDAAT